MPSTSTKGKITEAPDRDAIGRFGLHVARGGVEPPTYRFSVGRSYQLSYLAKRVECYMSATAAAESVGQRTRSGYER